jgi:hypothetical protein
MSHRPNPYRVLAHALDVGDHELAALLRRRLHWGGSQRNAALGAVDRLLRVLGIAAPRD